MTNSSLRSRRTVCRWPILLTGVVLQTALGCGSGSNNRPLLFDSTTHEFGIVETAGSVRHRFDFRVWDNGPVRITHIGSTCCGALPIDPDLKGQLLEPGSSHFVDVILGREYSGERAQVDVNIETDPRSSEPLVLSVSGLLIKSVQAHPNPLVIQQSSGLAATGKLRLTRLRSSDIKQLELDMANSSFIGLTVRGVDSTTDQVGHPSLSVPRFVDAIEIELSPQEGLADGQHEFACRLAWKNEGLTTTLVPVTVLVSHPYRPVLDTVFCGVIPPGATWESALRMVRQGAPETLRVASVSSSVPWASAAVDEQSGNVLLRVTPDGRGGRIEAVLTLVYNDSRVPDFKVNVSGLVRGD